MGLNLKQGLGNYTADQLERQQQLYSGTNFIYFFAIYERAK
jgi:hypothetical protein